MASAHSATATIKILFLGANPAGTVRLALDLEVREITQRLRATPYTNRFELVQEWAVRVGDLQAALLRHQPQIVHFSGHSVNRTATDTDCPAAGTSHGAPGATQGRSGAGIIVEGEGGYSVPILATALGDLFGIVGGVRCVVLNACYSAAQADAIRPHVGAVIGMGEAIQDKTAVTFAWSFYQGLGFGKSIGDAFALGKNQVDLAGIPEAEVPRLFMDNDQRLVEPEGRSQGAAGEESSEAPENQDISRRQATKAPPPLLRRFQRCYGTFIRWGLVQAPEDRADICGYLAATASSLDELNARGLGNVDFVPPDWSDLPRTPSPAGEWGTSTSAQAWKMHVRDRLRALQRGASGRPGATAQLIAAEHKTRQVHNLVQELEQAVEPIVLLGDPGSGKSTTLRALGNALARHYASTGEPHVVVYVRLGHVASSPGKPHWSVLSLIQQSIPPAHSEIRAMVPQLAAAGRLVVLFDGLDELTRRDGAEAAQALSAFGRDYHGRVKCVFACRTLEFDPSFGHRQVLLLPFDEWHIRDYLKRALPDPVHIEGQSLLRKTVIRRLLAEEDVAREFLRSPMLLYLTCFYIMHEKKWPASRRDIFTRFLEDFEGRVGGESTGLREGWRTLAYEMTVAGTTVWEAPGEGRHPLHEKALASGLAAGLLLRDGDEAGRVRFSHHRFQEYLTAEYVAGHSDAIQATVLDEPRWHETLLDLAALHAESPAIGFLFDALHTMPGDDSLGTQRAYRLHLAARILNVVGSPTGEAHIRLRSRFEACLRDVATNGNPAVQVIALWAYAVVPNLPWEIVRDGPLHSNVHWVREQALSLALRGDAVRAQAGDDFAELLMTDMLKGRFSLHVGAYFRATSRAKRNRMLLAWTIACASVSAMLSLFFISLASAQTAGTIAYRITQYHNDSFIAKALVAGSVAFGTILWIFAKIPLAVAWRTSAGALIAFVTLVLGVKYDQMRDAAQIAVGATFVATISVEFHDAAQQL